MRFAMVLALFVSTTTAAAEPASTVVAAPGSQSRDIASRDQLGPLTERRPSRVVAAYTIASVGAATILGGVVTGLIARSRYLSATKNCLRQGEAIACPERDYELANSATTLGNAGTMIGGVGLAAVLGGAVLYFTAPRDTIITPVASSRAAGLAISGTF